MSRREAIRISLGTTGTVAGATGSVPCVVIELSATGAQLAVDGRLPEPPLTLQLALGGEPLQEPVTVWRVPDRGRVAITFAGRAGERMHRLIAAEQRLARAAGRRNVIERRTRRASARGLRGEVI